MLQQDEHFDIKPQPQCDFVKCKKYNYFYNGITDDYPISYRLILVHALNRFIKNDSANMSEMESIRGHLKNIVKQFNISGGVYVFDHYRNLFEFYLFEYGDESNPRRIGLMIDHHKDIYPLVFYDYAKDENVSDRLSVFIGCLDEICKKWDSLIEEIKQSEDENILDNETTKNTICKMLDKIK